MVLKEWADGMMLRKEVRNELLDDKSDDMRHDDE